MEAGKLRVLTSLFIGLYDAFIVVTIFKLMHRKNDGLRV